MRRIGGERRVQVERPARRWAAAYYTGDGPRRIWLHGCADGGADEAGVFGPPAIRAMATTTRTGRRRVAAYAEPSTTR